MKIQNGDGRRIEIHFTGHITRSLLHLFARNYAMGLKMISVENIIIVYYAKMAADNVDKIHTKMQR